MMRSVGVVVRLPMIGPFPPKEEKESSDDSSQHGHKVGADDGLFGEGQKLTEYNDRCMEGVNEVADMPEEKIDRRMGCVVQTQRLPVLLHHGGGHNGSAGHVDSANEG